MPNRRDFIGRLAGATAGVFIGGRGLADAAQTTAARRRASIGGRRVTVIDVHAHCFVPEVWEVVKDTPLAATARTISRARLHSVPARRSACSMDKEGIDYSGHQRQRVGATRPNARSRATLSRRAE